MAIESTSSVASTTNQTSSIGLQDFLKILLTQLTYQDPLKPMDNQQFMAQIAQFTTLQQTQELNDRLAVLIGNQAALQSVGLIGRTVDLNTDSGAVTGVVKSLSLSGSAPTISLETTAGATLTGIDLSKITAVH